MRGGAQLVTAHESLLGVGGMQAGAEDQNLSRRESALEPRGLPEKDEEATLFGRHRRLPFLPILAMRPACFLAISSR